MSSEILYPEAGDVWKHHTGREYDIVALAYDQNGEVVVVHKSRQAGGETYTRSLSNFMGVMPGDLTNRFTYVR